METYTKTELLEAQGPFYQADASWRKKIEEWTADAVLQTEKSVPRSHCGRTAPHLYRGDSAYVLAVMFRMRSVGFSNRRICDVATILHNSFGSAPDPDRPFPKLQEYWEAAKRGDGEPESYRLMDRRGHIDPAKQTIAPGTPCELVIALTPDDGRGFPEGELSAFAIYGSASTAPQGYGEFRINLTTLFRAVKLPERKPAVEVPPVPVGRETLALAPIPRYLVPTAAVPVRRAGSAVSRKRRA